MAITLLGSTNSKIEWGDVSQIAGITDGLTVAITLNITGAIADNMRIAGQWGAGLAASSFLIAVAGPHELCWIVYGPSQLWGIATTALNLVPGLYRIVCKYDCVSLTGKIFVNGVDCATTSILGGSPTVINNGSDPVYVGTDNYGYDCVDGDYSHFAIWGTDLADGVCEDVSDGTTAASTLQASSGILYSPLATALDADDDWNSYAGTVTNGTTTGGGGGGGSTRNRVMVVT